MKLEHPALYHIPGLRQLWQEAFGDSDAFLDSFFDSAYHPTRCLCVTEGASVLAAAYWFSCGYDDHKAAYVYAVATARAHRGKGLCRRLMEQIHSILRQEGCGSAILVPGDASLARMYGAMGYQFFGGMETVDSVPDKTPVSVTEIGSEEFIRLRRQYLCPGGIVQEGENLAFLKRHFRFYRGDDFVLTAAVSDGKLYAPELLGDGAPASILTALGARSGTFRVPGSTPFAMYLQLAPGDPPRYFGFAFD